MILQLGYLTLTFAVCAMIIYFGIKTINESFDQNIRKKKRTLLIIGIIIWQGYLAVVGSSAFILSYSFPPRFALTMILPAFVFTGIFVYRNRNSDWLLHLPTKQIFFFQSFRILVETIFIFSVAAGILHKEASIEGYNFDMIYALTVPVLGFIAFRGDKPNLRLVRFWNYLGLAVLASVIFVFMSSIYKPEIYGASEPLLPLTAITYPYGLVAGCLMPVAVFMHVLSIAHLNRLIKK